MVREGVVGYTGGLDDQVKKLGFRMTPEAVDWNDAPGRTKEEVIKRLEDAAFGRGEVVD